MRAAQTTQTANKKMGKRTYTLKELAQRDFTSAQKVKDTAPKFNLVNIQEDLLDSQASAPLSRSPVNTDNNQSEHQSPITTDDQNLLLPIKLVEQLITKEIAKTATALELDVDELQAWINLQVMTPQSYPPGFTAHS